MQDTHALMMHFLLLGIFSCNSKLEECKADAHSVLNQGWKSCIVKKTDEVEIWTQALCCFYLQ